MNPFRIIAHRGASMRAPENTMAAFRAARETGSKEIKTDVQLTTDGVLVLCHDETLARYGHGVRRVETCAFAELAALDFGAWFSPAFAGERLVRLEDLFATFGSTFFYHIELKGAHPQLPARVLDAVKERELERQCVFTSFSAEQLRRARAHSADARLGWLVSPITDESLQTARELKLFQLCPKAANVTADNVRKASKIVEEVRAWGCPREKQAARETIQTLRETGCHGITMDEPLWAQ